jgi:site-specific recombinase XerD
MYEEKSHSIENIIKIPSQKNFQDISKKNQGWEPEVKYLETIMLQNQVLLSNIEELKDKIDELKNQNNELLLMTNYLVERAQEIEEKERLFNERQVKRQLAQKLQRRGYISSTEFFEISFEIMPKVFKNKYILARTRLASFLMFFLGLRVGNLLVLKVRHLKELMYNNQTEIPIEKKGRPNQLISLGEDAQRLLTEDFYDDVALVLKDKEDDYPVFTQEGEPDVPLHRVTHTNSINKALKFASIQFHKNLSTHSFRATFITEGIMNNIPIHIMQKAIGHKNIQSTEFYVHHDLSMEEWKQVLKNINSERVNHFKIKLQENRPRRNRKKQDLSNETYASENTNPVLEINMSENDDMNISN